MAEERKLVTVLFVDIVGSTSLGHDNDPEVVRAVLARYFDRVRDIAQTHGGTVEKFIGDAVMVVFGVPRMHDDDAERAVRAALAIQEAIGPLNADVALQLEARAGVNSGEAVAGVDEREQFLVTGDVVNVAARLQQHAEPGDVLVGALTQRLTSEAVEYESHAPIEARGKPEPVPAFRAIRARSEVPDQARGLPSMRARLVGRARELRLLVDTFERARDDRRSQLFTLVGSAGVGKSRLVGEFLARIAVPDVHVLRGRCLPYGTGITWWPFLEVIQADLGVTSAQSRSEVVERLEARLAELIRDERDRIAVRARLSVLLGLAELSDALPDVGGSRLPDELGGALAQYLDALSTTGPVVVVVDDLQWAEPPAVEIVRDLLDRALDVPLTVVCIARPELLEQEPAWGAGRPNSTVIVLEPLNEDETRTLIGRLLDIDDMPEELRSRIIARAEGNPLFCEEFVRMLIEEGRLVRVNDRWRAARDDSLDVRVPESIHALIASRLDALPPREKRLVAAASVIGEAFEAGQLAALVDDPSVQEGLAGLARRGLVVGERRSGAGAHRFRHLLIRDVAYATLPKAERARLHEAFARHLEATAGDRRDEFIEILAYHAERALALSIELRQPATELRSRARIALDLSVDSADRALRREDIHALDAFLATARVAASTLGDAMEPADRAHIALLVGQAARLRPDYAEARTALAEAARLAEEMGRHDLAGRASLALAQVYANSMADGEMATWRTVIEAARRHFDAAGDEDGRLAADVAALEQDFNYGRLTKMLEAGLEIASRAERTGNCARAASTYARLTSAAAWLGRGDLPEELGARAIGLAEGLGLSSTVRWARFFRARLAWMRGDFARAERETRALAKESVETGDGTMTITSHRLLGDALFEAGRLDEADEAVAVAIEASVRTGDRWSRTELLAHRATIRILRGELGTARQMLDESVATLRTDDLAAVAVIENTRGLLAAAEGDDREAERGLRRAVDLGRSTEYWWWARDAIDLAEFLVSRGRLAEAAPLVADAGALMRRFGYGLRRERLEALERQLEGQPALAVPGARDRPGARNELGDRGEQPPERDRRS